MTALRFCMVTTFYPPYSFGGDGVFVYRLSQALAERGHRVDVVHSVDAYRLQRTVEPSHDFPPHPNVTTHPLRSSWPRLTALGAHQLGRPAGYQRRLAQVLERQVRDAGSGSGQARDPYDVIHFHNVSLMGGPGVLRLGRAVKLYTPHEYWLVCPTHVLFKFDREACTRRQCLPCTVHARRPPQLWRHTAHLAACTRHIDRFLMPSRFALERHRADGLDRPMTVLPNFVPEPAQVPLGDPVAGRPFFLFVGRLEKLKGVQDLIAQFADYPAADLVIVGDGAYRPQLAALARGLANVEFRGGLHPQALGAYYRQAIAVLVPSLCYEVFPLIPAEALSHGTPVIARRIGALTEVIEDSRGGLLFSTPTELRAALDRLRTAPGLRERLGRAGQQVALAKWTAGSHLERYLAIVDEEIERRHSGARS